MKTVVGLMNTREEAQSVVQDLVDSGFSRDTISIMANEEGSARMEGEEGSYEGEARTKGAVKGAGIGAAIGGVAGLVAGLTGLAVPGIGPIIAAGPIAALLAGAGVGAVAGGAIGALTKMGVPEEHAHYYAEGVKRGGLLVTVSANDDNAGNAAEIMRRHGAVDIDKRAESWRQEGWTKFDESETVPHRVGRFDEIEATPDRAESFEEREGMHHAEAPFEESEAMPRTAETFQQREGMHLVAPLKERAAAPQVGGGRDPEGVTPAGQEEKLGQRQETQLEREPTLQAQLERESPLQENQLGRESTLSDLDDSEYERHFSSMHGPDGERFDAYRSAYHYAESRSSDPQLQGKEWPEVEEDIHRDWERSHQEPWMKVREAIHYGWDRTRRHH